MRLTVCGGFGFFQFFRFSVFLRFSSFGSFHSRFFFTLGFLSPGPGRPWQALAGPGRPWQALAGLGVYVRVGSAPAGPSRPSAGLMVAIRAPRAWSVIVLLVVHRLLSVHRFFPCLHGSIGFLVFIDSLCSLMRMSDPNASIGLPTPPSCVNAVSLYSTALRGVRSSPRIADVLPSTSSRW